MPSPSRAKLSQCTCDHIQLMRLWRKTWSRVWVLITINFTGVGKHNGN